MESHSGFLKACVPGIILVKPLLFPGSCCTYQALPHPSLSPAGRRACAVMELVEEMAFPLCFLQSTGGFVSPRLSHCMWYLCDIFAKHGRKALSCLLPWRLQIMHYWTYYSQLALVSLKSTGQFPQNRVNGWGCTRFLSSWGRRAPVSIAQRGRSAALSHWCTLGSACYGTLGHWKSCFHWNDVPFTSLSPAVQCQPSRVKKSGCLPSCCWV